MTVAALDLGKVRVGVAVSDEQVPLACPRQHLDGRDRKRLVVSIQRLVEREGITHFIVGLPLDARGEIGPAARRAQVFAEQVHEATGVTVTLWDERFTTTEAQRRLREGGTNSRKSKDKIDGAAACVLLQSWLDHQHQLARGDNE